MRVEIEGEYVPTPKEIVKCLWEDLDSRDCAELLLEIMALRERHYIDWLLQLDYTSEDLTQDMVLRGKVTKEEIIEVCDELKEHLISEFEPGEDTEFARERREVIAELKKYTEPQDRKWDGVNSHYYFYYDLVDNRFHIVNTSVGKEATLYFESKEKAAEALGAVGEDKVKKYYLELEDDEGEE